MERRKEFRGERAGRRDKVRNGGGKERVRMDTSNFETQLFP